jgi:transcriptional regulator with XRE-family HTH domain
MSQPEFARFCRKARQYKGWSQHYFAETAGISTATLRRIEREGSCSRRTVYAVAGALEANERELLKIKERP